MRRELPEELLPALSAIVAVAPRVQPTVRAPAPSRFADALATTGSYDPNASALVLMVQFLVTAAPTAKLAVDVAASARGARPATSAVAAVIPASLRTNDVFLIAFLKPPALSHWIRNELCGTSQCKTCSHVPAETLRGKSVGIADRSERRCRTAGHAVGQNR